MECFKCIQVCPTSAIGMDKSVSCARLVGRPALMVDEEKCKKCNQCNEICPMGNIALSAEGCSFCIICKSRPSCILPHSGRAYFPIFIASIARFISLLAKKQRDHRFNIRKKR